MRDLVLRAEVKAMAKARDLAVKAKETLKSESGASQIVFVLGGVVLAVAIIIIAKNFISSKSGEVTDGVFQKVKEALGI
jgi:hypothetical protein